MQVSSYTAGTGVDAGTLVNTNYWQYCTINCASTEFIFYSTAKGKYYCVACSTTTYSTPGDATTDFVDY